MGNLWLKIRIWFKTILFVLVLVYIFVFVIKNNEQTVDVWLFYNTRYKGSLLLVLLLTFVAGVVTTLLVRTIFNTLRQVREYRDRARSQKLEREIHDMKTKAAMLQTKPTDPPSA